MPQSKFEVGDIVEHKDGSLYLIVEDTGDRYKCVTFQETNDDFRASGAQYACNYHLAFEKLTRVGHIDEEAV